MVLTSENEFILKSFANGDIAKRIYKGIVIEFAGKRKTISTSLLNGGCRDDLIGCFNYNCLAEEMLCRVYEDSYEKELIANGNSLGLDGINSTGISTAAWMEMASVVTKSYKDLEVTAIVTGGIDSNGTRVGDPASYYEESGVFYMLTPGTINVLLHINANMSYGTLSKALMTASIAKANACEELYIGSLYSQGLATGSGTDGMIIVSDAESKLLLTDAGDHAKLGELISLAVKEAVKEALFIQTGAGAARQHNLLVRTKRYGITMGSLWEYYINNKEQFEGLRPEGDLDITTFEGIMSSNCGCSTVVVWGALYVHILDELREKMLVWGEGVRETRSISENMLRAFGFDDFEYRFPLDLYKETQGELIRQMQYFIIVLALKIGRVKYVEETMEEDS